MNIKPLTLAIACVLAGCQSQEDTTRTSNNTTTDANGAISSAVCQDFNMNGQCEAAEGLSASGQNISGAANSTGYPVLLNKDDYVLLAPSDATYISPFTSLIESERLFNPQVNKDTALAVSSLNSAFSNLGVDFSAMLNSQGNSLQSQQIEKSLRSAQQLAPHARYAAVAASVDKMVQQQQFDVSIDLNDINEYLHDTVVNVQYQDLTESTRASTFASAAGITLAATSTKLVLLEGSNSKSFSLSLSNQSSATAATSTSTSTNAALNSLSYVAATQPVNWNQYRADDDDDDDSGSGASSLVPTPTTPTYPTYPTPTTPVTSGVQINSLKQVSLSPSGKEALVLSQQSFIGFTSPNSLICASSTTNGDGLYRISLEESKSSTTTNQGTPVPTTTTPTSSSYLASSQPAWAADSISAASGGITLPTPTPTPVPTPVPVPTNPVPTTPTTPTAPTPTTGQLGAIVQMCSNDDVNIFAEHWNTDTLLVSDISGGYIQKVDLTTLRPISALTLPSGSYHLNALTFDPSGKYALAGNDSGIWLLDVSNMKAIDALGGLTPSAEQVDGVAFYNLSRNAVSWQENSDTLERFSLSDSSNNYQRPVALASIDLPSPVQAAVMLDKQQSIAVAGSDRKIYIIDLVSGTVTRTLPALDNSIRELSVEGNDILALDSQNRIARINFRNVVGAPLDIAAQNLTLESILGDNSDSQRLTSPLTLPTSITGITGVAITWVSSDNSLVDSSGNVTRPSGFTDLPVTLTAKLSRAGRNQIETQTKAFSLKVSSQ